MGNLPAELAAVLEGRYVISKLEQNTCPNAAPSSVRIWRRGLLIRRHMRRCGPRSRLPRCCGGVPSKTLNGACGCLWPSWPSARVRSLQTHFLSSLLSSFDPKPRALALAHCRASASRALTHGVYTYPTSFRDARPDPKGPPARGARVRVLGPKLSLSHAHTHTHTSVTTIGKGAGIPRRG